MDMLNGLSDNFVFSSVRHGLRPLGICSTRSFWTPPMSSSAPV